jgi:CheY-like chemotaxis protein
MDMTSTILLVDDYPDAVDVLAIYLRGEGFEVLTACDGEHALREARRVRPQLIVMDLEMPILSGYEVAARLRADAETRDIPLIAATGHSHARQLEEARLAGFDAVIVKPCDPDELVREIRRLVQAPPAAGG